MLRGASNIYGCGEDSLFCDSLPDTIAILYGRCICGMLALTSMTSITMQLRRLDEFLSLQRSDVSQDLSLTSTVYSV